jgi:hypothetical protein
MCRKQYLRFILNIKHKKTWENVNVEENSTGVPKRLIKEENLT